MYEGMTFVRTENELMARVAIHNRQRIEWIAEAGEDGRTYEEINAPKFPSFDLANEYLSAQLQF